MTKESDRFSRSGADSELGTAHTARVNKITAILCPTFCALLLVCMFTVSFIGAKMAYEQYDALCSRKFDVGKLYIFPNVTVRLYHNKH